MTDGSEPPDGSSGRQGLGGPWRRLFSASVLESAFGLVTAVTFAHALAPSVYGTGLALIATAAVVVGWASLGTEEFVTTDISREWGAARPGAAAGLFRALGRVRSRVLVVVVTVVVILTSLDVKPFEDPSTSSAWLTYVVLHSSLSWTQVGLLAHQRFGHLARASVSASAARAAGAVAVLALGVDEQVSVVWVYACAAGFATLAVVREAVRLSRAASGVETGGLTFGHAVTRHGKWGIVHSLVKQGADPVPQVILAVMAGGEALAILRLALRAVEVLQTPVNVLGRILTPMLAMDLDEARALSERAFAYAGVLALGMIGVAVVAFGPAERVLLPTGYKGTAVYALALSPTVVSAAMRIHQRPLLYALRRQDLVFGSYIVETAVEIAAGAAAIALWGLSGLVVVTVAGTLAIFAIREVMLARLGYSLRPAGVGYALSRSLRRGPRDIARTVLGR